MNTHSHSHHLLPTKPYHTKPRALYIHVPFCPHICPYCDFHKMRRHEGLVSQYVQRLQTEAKALYERYPQKLDTIYLGGGTPSHLKDAELRAIFDTLRDLWGLDAQEITLEADPLTFTPERLAFFKHLGINRLSIGLQSTQDAILKFLGRQHNGSEGLQAVQWGLESDFNVSADLITSITGQNTASDLHALAQTGVPHISVYSLTIEAHTPFARRGITVSEDKDFHDYQLTHQVLSGYGLERYEVSSHAKAGFASQHNQIYWHGEYFLALGPSAAGFVPYIPYILSKSSDAHAPFTSDDVGVRYVNPPIKHWLRGDAPEILPVSKEDFVREQLLTGLRTRRGVDSAQLQARSQIDVFEKYGTLIAEFQAQGLLYIDNMDMGNIGDTKNAKSPFLRTTEKGLLQLNGLIQAFYKL